MGLRSKERVRNPWGKQVSRWGGEAREAASQRCSGHKNGLWALPAPLPNPEVSKRSQAPPGLTSLGLFGPDANPRVGSGAGVREGPSPSFEGEAGRQAEPWPRGEPRGAR